MPEETGDTRDNESPTAPAAPPDRRALRRGLIVAVAIGASFAVGIGVLTVDARTLSAARGMPGPIALGALMVLCAWVAEGAVFASLAGWPPRRVLIGTRVYLASCFPSAVTPFASGAVPAMTWLLWLEGLSAGEAAAVVGARALVTGVFFSLAGAATLVAAPRYLPPAWRGGFTVSVAVLIVSGAALVYLALRPARLAAVAEWLGRRAALRRLLGAERLDRLTTELAKEAGAFSASLRRFRGRPLALPAALLATLVSRALLFGVVPVLLYGLGWRGDVGPVLLATLVVGVVGSSSPTPGGSGAAEAALAVLLSATVPRWMLGVTVVLWRLLTFYAEAGVGAVLFAGALRRATRPRA
jgi:glycosyltransferase 2 family protein